MKTIKYEIEFPGMPDDCEITQGVAKDGEKAAFWNGCEWEWRLAASGITYPYIARRRETLAGWANKQRLFQALAEIFKARMNARLSYDSYAHWIFDADFMQRQTVALEAPPVNLTGKLRLEAGKWVDAT